MDFEEDGDSNWEFVMIQTKKKSRNDDNDENESDHDASDQEEATEEVLDMPPPWSPKL